MRAAVWHPNISFQWLWELCFHFFSRFCVQMWSVLHEDDEEEKNV